MRKSRNDNAKVNGKVKDVNSMLLMSEKEIENRWKAFNTVNLIIKYCY